MFVFILALLQDLTVLLFYLFFFFFQVPFPFPDSQMLSLFILIPLFWSSFTLRMFRTYHFIFLSVISYYFRFVSLFFEFLVIVPYSSFFFLYSIPSLVCISSVTTFIFFCIAFIYLSSFILSCFKGFFRDCSLLVLLPLLFHLYFYVS